MRFLVPSSVYVYSRKNGKDGATSWCLQASHCCTGGWFLQEQSRVVSCVRGHGLVWEEDKELRFLFISGLLYRNEVTHILHRTRNTTDSVTFYVLTEKGSMKVSRVINILDMFFSVGCLSTASWSFHSSTTTASMKSYSPPIYQIERLLSLSVYYYYQSGIVKGWMQTENISWW